MAKCPVKDCHNEATVEFGPFVACEDCYNKCAYDMQPLILKENQGQQDLDKET